MLNPPRPIHYLQHDREIRSQLLDAPLQTSFKLLPSKRINVPSSEKLAPLPPKYRKHIGNHQAHPGEGKGRMALRREKDSEAVEAA